MASANPEEKDNFIRLSQLLFGIGTEALRKLSDDIHPPAHLSSVLDATSTGKTLSNKKCNHCISDQQWDSLFPPSSSPPDSKNFDVKTLNLLLCNICDLSRPANGWTTMPPDSDRSRHANIVRIMLYRDQVLAHSTKIDNARFEDIWRTVSQALVELNVPQNEIDDLKNLTLAPSEESRGPRVNSDSWEWKETSVIHRQKFENLHEYGRHSPQKITEINDVRVCFENEFLINTGCDGTCVFVGLSKDGGERAVKRLVRSISGPVAEQEKGILNERNAVRSNHVVHYRFLDKSNNDWLYLIMDLCEETLEDFVLGLRSVPNGEWSETARDIIQQVLTGLSDIHRDPRGILHRDLKPSNILRDVDGYWLLADFGISRILTIGTTHITQERGTDNWKAAESISSDGSGNVVRYKKESDIQVAGMMAFYVLTKGKHPFGEEPYQRHNILHGDPVYLNRNMVNNPAANDLISWMLSHQPKDRPLANEALKHPYLASPDQQFKMLCEVANQREIKSGEVDSDVVQKLNAIPGSWQQQMDPKVRNYLSHDFVSGRPYTYAPSWCGVLRLIRNVNQHWYDISRQRPQPDEEFYLVDIPQNYFLNVFPNLPTDVHRIVRSSDWKERPNLKEYFK